MSTKPHWFYYLVSNEREEGSKRIALFDTGPVTPGTMVICRDTGSKLFAKFPSYLDFGWFYLKNTTDFERHDFEVIMGNHFQKPYFDLDIHRKEELKPVINYSPQVRPEGVPTLPKSHEPKEARPVPEVTQPQFTMSIDQANIGVEILVETIAKVLTDLNGSPIKNGSILVFTSHSADKLSYHIIVDGWCVSDHKQNRAFHNLVMKDYPKDYHAMVDHSVYSSIRQFRIYKSRKFKSERIKLLDQKLTKRFTPIDGILAPNWIPPIVPESEEHADILLLGASLVGNTLTCQMIPTIEIEQPKKRIFSDDFDMDILSSSDVDKIIDMATAKLEDFPFELSNVTDPENGSILILLKRQAPSYCDVCARVHEHENPYIIVTGQQKSIYFNCRRNKHNNLTYIGMLVESSTPEVLETLQEVLDSSKSTSTVFSEITSLQKMATAGKGVVQLSTPQSLSDSFDRLYIESVSKPYKETITISTSFDSLESVLRDKRITSRSRSSTEICTPSPISGTHIFDQMFFESMRAHK